MTYKEAINSLKTLKPIVEWGEPMEFQMAIDMGIEALEKQTPKKPWEETDEKCSYYHFLYKGSRYCPECGQKLDWSDEA